MNKRPAGALFIVPFLVAGSAIPPYHKEPHVEQEPTTPEPALLMDGAIISTLSGTAATIGQFSSDRPNQFE